MAEEGQTQDAVKGPMKRRIGHKKGGKGKMKPRGFQGSGGSGGKAKVDVRMKKIIRKRVRDYNSDDEEEQQPFPAVRKKYEHSREKYENSRVKHEHSREKHEQSSGKHEHSDGKCSDEDGEEQESDDGEREREDLSEDENGEIQPGVTKFTEGCNAFRMAFQKITKKSISDDALGPVLSAHKNLLAEKLADDDAERKVKGEAKKEKHLVMEKGHVQPASFSVSHEKFLIGVATKGVVKLFNAVNKAQHAQKGLNPSRTKDAKVLKKRRKDTFFSELGKPSSHAAGNASRSSGDGEGPSWAPLRDSYMLTNHKLKDWDKMQQDTTVVDEGGAMSSDSSSDED